MKHLNYCRSCNTDFASVAAFDRHRTGVREYLFAEGLLLEPPREDGRRCLAPEEMEGRGWRSTPRAAGASPRVRLGRPSTSKTVPFAASPRPGEGP